MGGVLSHPFDVVKTCMQGDMAQASYGSTLATARTLLAKGGYGRFLDGRFSTAKSGPLGGGAARHHRHLSLWLLLLGRSPRPGDAVEPEGSLSGPGHCYGAG